MICRKCRESATRGAANCPSCGRHYSALAAWDKKMQVVKTIGAVFGLFVALMLLTVIGKLLSRGADKLLDGIF